MVWSWLKKIFAPETGTSGWADLLDRSDVLICDTETSGLGKGAQILEIALVDTMGETVFSSLVAPPKGLRIQADASAITSDASGISREKQCTDLGIHR